MKNIKYLLVTLSLSATNLMAADNSNLEVRVLDAAGNTRAAATIEAPTAVAVAIKDASGAPLQGADLTLRNIATNSDTRTATTKNQGIAIFSNVSAGNWEIVNTNLNTAVANVAILTENTEAKASYRPVGVAEAAVGGAAAGTGTGATAAGATAAAAGATSAGAVAGTTAAIGSAVGGITATTVAVGAVAVAGAGVAVAASNSSEDPVSPAE